MSSTPALHYHTSEFMLTCCYVQADGLVINTGQCKVMNSCVICSIQTQILRQPSNYP